MDNIIDSLLIARFYTDVLLLISGVNGVVHECNVPAQLLRECTTLVSGCKHRAVTGVLNSFSKYLKN